MVRNSGDRESIETFFNAQKKTERSLKGNTDKQFSK